MKKLMSILLCVALLLGVCAAANASNESQLGHLLGDEKESLNYEEVIQNISYYLNKAKKNRFFSELCIDTSLDPINTIDNQANIVERIIEDGVFTLAAYTNALSAAKAAVKETKNVANLVVNEELLNKKTYERFMEQALWKKLRCSKEVLLNLAKKTVTDDFYIAKNRYLQALRDLEKYINGKK